MAQLPIAEISLMGENPTINHLLKIVVGTKPTAGPDAIRSRTESQSLRPLFCARLTDLVSGTGGSGPAAPSARLFRGWLRYGGRAADASTTSDPQGLANRQPVSSGGTRGANLAN